MIEQVQESMKEWSDLNSDALSAQSADLLRRLLDIEGEATNGNTHSAKSVSVQAPDSETGRPVKENENTVQVYVPYFGLISIAREGRISKEVPNTILASAIGKEGQPISFFRPSASSAETSYGEATASASIASLDRSCNSEAIIGYGCLEGESAGLIPLCQALGAAQAQETALPVLCPGDNSVDMSLTPQLQRPISGTLLQQYECPIFTAGIEDWAFQGVDSAFFNSLMRGGVGSGDGIGDDWATWQNGPDH
jgi:hypothetical protein